MEHKQPNYGSDPTSLELPNVLMCFKLDFKFIYGHLLFIAKKQKENEFECLKAIARKYIA